MGAANSRSLFPRLFFLTEPLFPKGLLGLNDPALNFSGFFSSGSSWMPAFFLIISIIIRFCITLSYLLRLAPPEVLERFPMLHARWRVEPDPLLHLLYLWRFPVVIPMDQDRVPLAQLPLYLTVVAVLLLASLLVPLVLILFLHELVQLLLCLRPCCFLSLLPLLLHLHHHRQLLVLVALFSQTLLLSLLSQH